MPEPGTLSDNEQAIHDKLTSRPDFDPWIADITIGILQGMGLNDSATYLNEGSRVVTFDTSFNQVFKVRKINRLEEIIDNNLVLKPVELIPTGNKYLMLVSPKITDKGETKFHQQVLRYELWRRGFSFLDIIPPASNPNAIKNIRIVPEEYGEYAGLPYVMDEGAVRPDTDESDHEIGPDGLRTYEAFMQYQKEQLWPNDRIPYDVMEKVRHHGFVWPSTQSSIFPSTIQNGDKSIDWVTIEAFAKSAFAHERISSVITDSTRGF